MEPPRERAPHGCEAGAIKLESVWEYPRPPRVEGTTRRLRVVQAGVEIANSVRSLRVLETSHPPAYYIPFGDIAMQFLQKVPGKSSYCEFKGRSTYWDVDVASGRTADGAITRVRAAAWSYEQPAPAFVELKGHMAFYADRLSECWVDEERVDPQAGSFYGGWITRDLVGPFKGTPGTMGW